MFRFRASLLLNTNGERPADEQRERYAWSERRGLSEAVLKAIEDQKGEDLSKSEFRPFDAIIPDALDRLFREDASANTSVRFDTDVTVELRGDGDVDIRVTPGEE